MRRNLNRFFHRLLPVLFLLFLAQAGCGVRAEESVKLTLTSDSRLSFSNAVYHYVTIQTEVQGADQLVLRVYKPDGTQVKYKIRRNTPTAQDAGMSSAYSVNESGNGLDGTELLFPSNSAVGVWTIEVRALRKKEVVAVATLPVEVWNPQRIEMADYDRVHAMLLPEDAEQPVERGKIRFVAQLPEDHCFIHAYWRSRYYDLTDTARTKCTRAIFSMAMSWLGIDCTPVRMSELVKTKEIYYTYEHVIDALETVEQLDGKLEVLWDNYLYAGASPIEIHFNYEGGGMHAVLLIARDSRNPDIFYALNPSEGVDATAYGGKKHDHVIPIIIEDGRIGGVIQSPLIKRYHKGKIDVICQWSLIDEPEDE